MFPGLGPRDSEALLEQLGAAIERRLEDATTPTFQASRQDVPDPGLDIPGKGPITLPLSARNARGMTRVFRGDGDAGRKGCWAVSHEDLQINNPEFQEHMTSNILQALADQLGLDLSSTPAPVLEVEQLLLCESELSLPAVSGYPNDVYARILVFLPSQHTGGDFHLLLNHPEHENPVRVIAHSHSSSTTFYAWRTQDTHIQFRYEPTTSGFKLALLFNLRLLNSIPVQQKPTLDVGKVLKSWRAGAFSTFPKGYPVAYLLGQRYDENQFKKGSKCLQDDDSRILRAVKSAADEQGFTLALANLVYTREGEGVCYMDQPGDRLVMGDEYEERVLLSSLAGLNGKKVTLPEIPDNLDFIVSANFLMPIKPFDDAEPDEEEAWYTYGDQGYKYIGDSVTFKYSYFRSALVIFPDTNLDEVFSHEYGLKYIFPFLQAFKPEFVKKGDSEYSKWVDRAMDVRDKWKEEESEDLYRFAILWKDEELIRSIVESKSFSISTLGDFSETWRSFGFTKLKQSLLAHIVENVGTLKDRIEFIDTLRSYPSDGNNAAEVQTWCDGAVAKALSSYQEDPDVNEIRGLISLIQSRYWMDIRTSLIPGLLQHPDGCEFFLQILDALYKIAPVTTTGEAQGDMPKSDVQETIHFCLLQLPGLLWNHGHLERLIQPTFQSEQSRWYNGEDMLYFLRYSSDIFDICVHLLRPQEPIYAALCQEMLFDVLRKLPPSHLEILNYFYITLLYKMAALLKELKLSPASPPVVDFFQIVIGAYLHTRTKTKDIIGGPPVVRIRTIGCRRCPNCATLNTFLKDPTQQQITFESLSISAGDHLKGILTNRRGRGLSTFRINRVPRSRRGMPEKQVDFVVTKKSTLHDSIWWMRRSRHTEEFLRHIGDEEVLKSVMRDMWDDLVAAREGKALYPALDVEHPAFAPARNKRKADTDIEEGHWDMTVAKVPRL